MSLQFDKLIIEERSDYAERARNEWSQCPLTVKKYVSYIYSLGKKYKNPNNSAVLYVLGITDDKPVGDLKISSGGGAPDLDLDFGHERRNEVIEYAQKKYGSDRVAHIITFGSMRLRAAIRDVARAQQIENYISVSDRIAKAISVKEKTLESAVESSEFLQKKQRELPELFRMAEFVTGKPRQPGIHPAGVLVTPKPITEYMPLYYGGRSKRGDISIIQWDMYDVEDAGFLKIDFLGLKTLTVIQKTLARVNQNRDNDGLEPLDIESIDLEDPTTLKWFSEGLTTGIFQLERKYVQDFCRRMKIDSFNDVIVMNAIIRPGTMDAGMTEEFIKRKNGKSESVPPHESLSSILADTQNIFIFQEQLMKAVVEFAGFSLAESDELRKIVGKKQLDKIPEMRDKFYKMSISNGRTEEEIENVWSKIETFGRYGFNASHSCAYGKITFQAEYLKAHYTLEFMCELLNGEYNTSSESKINTYVDEARYLGIDIIPPSVVTSGPMFEIRDGNKIEFGLAFVKQVSITAANAIARIRGQYNNFTDFLMLTSFSTVQSKAVNNLIEVGAFDHFGGSRDYLIERHMKMRVLVKKYKDQQDRKSKGVNLRSELTVDELYEMEREHIDIVEVRDLEQSLAREFELSGAYLSDSPMAPFEYEIRTLANTDIADLRDGLCKIVDRQLVLVGLVDSFREHTIKSGKYEGQLMAFLTIKKDQKSIDCLVFAKQYAKFNEIIEEGKVYLFKGWFRDGSFIANQIQLLSNL